MNTDVYRFVSKSLPLREIYIYIYIYNIYITYIYIYLYGEVKHVQSESILHNSGSCSNQDLRIVPAWSVLKPHIEACTIVTLRTLCVPYRVRNSVYLAPNSIAHLFRFDWNSGFAEIWWPSNSLVFTNQQRIVPGQVGIPHRNTSELRTHHYPRIARIFETNRVGTLAMTQHQRTVNWFWLVIWRLQ